MKNLEPQARRVFQTRAQDQGRLLRDYLSGKCPEIPAGFLNKLIRNGCVRVDTVPADMKTRIGRAQTIALYLPEDAFLVAPNPAVTFEVLHEDDDVVVIDKPAGLVSEPGIGHKLDTLLNGLVARYGAQIDRIGPRSDFGMVHRLDRDTSGLMLFARSEEMHRRLKERFRLRQVHKKYLALVSGRLEKDEGLFDAPIIRARRGGRMRGMVGDEAGQPALTRWHVLEKFGDATFLEAEPRTGRWRQIRLHFAAAGHPVAGDLEEGDPAANANLRKRAGLERMFLHSAELSFKHPRTGKSMVFSLELPQELQEVLAKLRDADLRA